MRRKWVLSILCVLLIVGASSDVSAASKNFGTAATDLWDDSVNATAPDISDWVYSHDEWKTGVLYVEITCEFTDNTCSDIQFSFNFTLRVELWQVFPYPGEFIEVAGFDHWSVSNYSSNWLNAPVVHSDTLSVLIAWHAPESYMYKCVLDVDIWNVDADVMSSDSETWWITMDM